MDKYQQLFQLITPKSSHKFLSWAISRTQIDFSIYPHMYLIFNPGWLSLLIYGLLFINGYVFGFFGFFIIYVLSIYLFIWYSILKRYGDAPSHFKTEKWISDHERDEKRREDEQKQKKAKRVIELKISIPKLLKEKAVKIPASDIDAFLKHQDVDEIKEVCESLYQNGKINRTGNYRYFILTEEKKKPKVKKASAPKSEKVDVEKELEKLKGLLDKGLITQEQYDAKSNKLLGL